VPGSIRWWWLDSEHETENTKTGRGWSNSLLTISHGRLVLRDLMVRYHEGWVLSKTSLNKPPIFEVHTRCMQDQPLETRFKPWAIRYDATYRSMFELPNFSFIFTLMLPDDKLGNGGKSTIPACDPRGRRRPVSGRFPLFSAAV
jgi:hypothetical protein